MIEDNKETNIQTLKPISLYDTTFRKNIKLIFIKFIVLLL